MIKDIRKIVIFTIAFIICISTLSFAATVNSQKATLQIVENNICTINIKDIANFEKKIISSDLEKKELTLQLKVTNTADVILNKPTEIFLVIDNSLSMKDEVSTGVTRLKTVTDSAKTLATELLKNEYVKIGIVSFSTGDNEGTITDASLKTVPSNVEDTVLNSITSIADGELGARTNIDAGITLANQNFSEDCESKYIILLTDGVPNTAVGGPTFTYSGETAIKTKAKLQTISNFDVNIFSVMTGVPNVEEPTTGMTYKELAEEIFGTTAEPTVGKFYYIPDSQIEETICETILSNFMDPSLNTLTNLVITDFFPQEIIDNFDFEYVTSPNIGTVSSKIDLTNNCIVWTIDKLEPKDVATLSYKLKLKENINESILNVILNTNKKVEITANEIKTDDGTNILTSTVTPKVRVNLDNTVKDTVIPQTGSTSTPFIITSIVIIACGFVGIRFYLFNKNIK